MDKQNKPAPRKVLSLKRPAPPVQVPATATHASSASTRSQRKAAALKVASQVMATFYPAVFSHTRLPLAIGTLQQVFADIAAGKLPLSKQMARSALTRRANGTAYLEALIKGGPRYDLHGNVDGEVTAEQQNNARVRLAAKLEQIANRPMA